MILVFVLAGTFTATLAGAAALVMGHPWWIGLASYVATGMLTVLVLAVFTAITLKVAARKTDTSAPGAGMALAKQ